MTQAIFLSYALNGDLVKNSQHGLVVRFPTSHTDGDGKKERMGGTIRERAKQ
jgi:hypothetical protein